MRRDLGFQNWRLQVRVLPGSHNGGTMIASRETCIRNTVYIPPNDQDIHDVDMDV